MSTTVPTAPTRAQFKPFKEVRTIGEALKHPEMIDRFKLATPKHLSPERMLRVCAMAVQKTPKLAECDLMSLLGAMLSLASLGLEPNTALGHAHLIPFEKREKVNGNWRTIGVEVQPIVGYRGYIDLARRSGNLVAIHADVVYEGDEFSFSYGSDMHLRHRPALTRKQHRPLWAYFYCKLTDGDAFEVLPYAEVLKIRDAAEGYKSALRNKERYPQSWEKNPWVAFEHEMAAKTMIRRINKRLPMSIEMANAAALDAMSEVGKVDFKAIATAPISDMMDTRELTYEEYVQPFDISSPNGEEPEEERVETRHEEPPQQQRRQTETRTAAPSQRPQEAFRQPSAPVSPQPEQATQAAANQAFHERPRDPAPGRQPPEETHAEPAKAPRLQLYLVDAEGSLTDDGFFTNARAYASALGTMIAEADAGDREAILDQNAEYIEQAGNADVEAHAMLRYLVEALVTEEVRESAGDIQPVQVPTKGRGTPDLAAYVGLARVSLENAVTDDATLQAWIAINKPIYERMPTATRRGIDIAIAARRDALGLSGAPAPQAPQEARPEAPQQPNEITEADVELAERQIRRAAYVADAVAAINAMPSGREALAWVDSNVTEMTALKQEAPDDYQRIRDAVSAKVRG